MNNPMRQQTRFRNVVSTWIAMGAVAMTPRGAMAKHTPVSDEQVTEAIERAFIEDPGVGTDPITVTTHDGVVTLSGVVRDLRTVWRAVDRAENIKGVRSVVNTLKIEPAFRADDEIRKDVELALEQNAVTDDFTIHVTVRGGRVTLSGVVQSWQEKEIATEVVGGVRGIAAIDNWLRVDFTAPRPDSVIAKDVREILRWDALVDDSLLDVSVKAGVVTLAGSVGSAAERTRAKQDALALGVKSVDADGVSVEWLEEDIMARHEPVTPTDDKIHKAVSDALRQDPRVDGHEVTCAVRDGEVTLTGTVDNLWSRDAAAQDATDTVGVVRVHNFLKVGPRSRIGDQQLSARVQAAIKRDPDLNRYDISAKAIDGTVVLRGNLPSLFDRDLVEVVVAKVRDVAAIDDLIGVTGMAERKSDWEIEEDIRSQMWWSPYVHSKAVDVTVRDGVATLTGAVASWRERQAAETNAREGGALRVHNEIELKTWQ